MRGKRTVGADFSGGVELYDPDEGGATLPRHMGEPSMAGSGEEMFLERATFNAGIFKYRTIYMCSQIFSMVIFLRVSLLPPSQQCLI